jgi:hypothetical protein
LFRCTTARQAARAATLPQGADVGTQAVTDDADLEVLSDPEFFARWAAVRSRLALMPKTGAGRDEARQEYDAVTAEYRRRMEGAA